MQVTEVKPRGTPCQPEPQHSQDQEVTKTRQETEGREVFSLQEAENVKEEVKNKEDEEVAPARLYSDWTRGSVRRVTQQLEQRMKKEHETPSPSSSPPSFSGCTSHSQRRPHSIHSTTASPLQGDAVLPQVSVVGSQEEQEEAQRKLESVKGGSALVVDMGVLENEKSTKGHKPQAYDSRLLSTSSPFHYSTKSPFASVNFLCLEGVTELESVTDWDCFTEGFHSDIIMRETWETLRELGAFLQQVSMGGTCRAKHAGQALGTTQKPGSGVQKRVREVEARIRQAGLTPPSLMKRSASLAKLGCLELLANDLANEWELSRSALAPPSAQAPAHAVSDESKKQRVHSSSIMRGEEPETIEITTKVISEDGGTSPGISAPSNQNPQSARLTNTGQDSWHSPGPTLLTARQQYGRTHPLRRLKKRTVSTLYHTM